MSDTINEQPVNQEIQAPVTQLKTNRSMLKVFLLNLITLNIYGIVVMSGVSSDINVIASRYDGKKTMHFCLLTFIIAPITLGIAAFVWFHNISSRMGKELQRRGIDYKFGAKDYWLWNVLGALIIVGPFIYFHKFFTASNKLAENFNTNG